MIIDVDLMVSVVEAATDAVFILDHVGMCVYGNRPAREISGCTEEELVSSSFLDFVHPEFCEIFSQAIQDVVLRHHSSSYLEYPLQSREGRIVWVGQELFLVKSSEGTTHLCALCRNITTRKRREYAHRSQQQAVRRLYEESRIAEELFLCLANSWDHAVVVYDLQGAPEFVNEAFVRLLGWTMDDLRGSEIPYALQPLQENGGPPIRSVVMEGIPSGGFDTRLNTKDGRLVDVAVSASLCHDEEGKPSGILVLVSDNCEKKRMEKELEQSIAYAARLRSQTESAHRAKNEFLANMSHELRTPLTAIIGFSEILEDTTFGELNERQQKYVGYILNSGRHLLQVINDILDLAKVDSGKMDLQLNRVKVRQVLENSLIIVREKAHRHRIRLDLSMDDTFSGLEIEADEVKLKQILFNLLSNAVKFTPDGGIVSLGAHQDEENILISVSDTGVGLKPEDCERIFMAFEQVHSPYTGQHQGTGLGLALTRSLVELHGGSIWVESAGEGRGSTFRFTLPKREIVTGEFPIARDGDTSI